MFLRKLKYAALVIAVAFPGVSPAQPRDTGSIDAAEVFYFTNREQEMLPNGGVTYGSGRSRALYFGVASVTGKTVDEERVTDVQPMGSFPLTPYAVEKVGGGIRRSSSVLADHRLARRRIQDYLKQRVANTSTKQVVLFVHGYNNGFEDAIKSTDQICNDLGWNDFVCVAFSWPAGGSRGILFGYNVDRESGEFAVFDLQRAIRAISETPGVGRIYLICHSRGADVTTMALQQLTREAYMDKTDFVKKFKITDIVLAAPDVDIDVAFTRIGSLRSDPDLPFGNKPNPEAIFNHQRAHFTIYTSPEDKALSVSKELWGSKGRLGLVDEKIDDETRDLISATGDIADFISVDNVGASLFGHDYYLSSPLVRNDLVNLIKNKKRVGDVGRELVEIHHPFWRLAPKP